MAKGQSMNSPYYLYNMTTTFYKALCKLFQCLIPHVTILFIKVCTSKRNSDKCRPCYFKSWYFEWASTLNQLKLNQL